MSEIGEIAGVGNTGTPAKRIWCLTWNNYPVTTWFEILKSCNPQILEYVFGEEIGDEGTPHIQGVIRFKNSIKLNTLKKIDPSIHWEGCRSWKHSVDYCMKGGNYKTNITTVETIKDTIMRKKYANVVWKDWQKEIIDIVEGPPDDRTIYWVWEPEGGAGKSFLCKYLGIKYDAIIGNGKKNDVFNQVKTYIDEKKKCPSLVILDVPRSDIDYFNYGVLEKLKDGMLYSGKYEGGVVYLDDVHCIVFANTEPILDCMSKDRWKLIRI